MEVSVAAAPITDARERVRHENFFRDGIYETDAVLVDCHQEMLRETCITVLLYANKNALAVSAFGRDVEVCTDFDFEKCRSESWPFEYVSQESDLRVLHG